MTLRRIIPREAALADFDEPYEHRGHPLRVLTHGDYRVFYREQGREIDLLRVINGRRNIPDMLDELDGLL